MLLADNETKVDLLNNEAIATTIIKLLRDKPDKPVTVGVHGDWGAGKSSVLEMIEAGFEGEPKVLCLKFNGWRFQGFEDAKIALIEGIVTGLIEKRPALTKAGEAVKDVFRRIDWLKVAKKAGGLAFTAFTGVTTPDQIQAILGTINGVLSNPSQLATKENAEKALGGIKELLKEKDGESTNVPEEISAFRKAFDDLLTKAGVEQLVVLIDDLDRCLPDTAIETLEAVRLFVFTSRTAFVVAADEAMIEYSVRKHFPDLPDTTGPQSYARNYLEKLIQVPFPHPGAGRYGNPYLCHSPARRGRTRRRRPGVQHADRGRARAPEAALDRRHARRRHRAGRARRQSLARQQRACPFRSDRPHPGERHQGEPQADQALP